MPERKLSVLEARKRLLVAESEINRTLLVRDVQSLKADLHDVAQPLRSLGSLASSIAVFLSLFKGFAKPKAEKDASSNSWFSGNMIQLGLALWEGMRGRNPAPPPAPVAEDSYEAAGE